MDEFARAAFREREARQTLRRRALWFHGATYAAVNLLLVALWALTDTDHPWFVYPLLGWGVGLAIHAAATLLVRHPDDIILEREQRRLEEA